VAKVGECVPRPQLRFRKEYSPVNLTLSRVYVEEVNFMRWSVAVQTEGDQVMSQKQIVELADTVAKHDGVASGIGQTAYGAKIIVNANSKDEAEAVAKQQFTDAAKEANMPDWPIVKVESISEEEEEEQDWWEATH
jgi:hypothetical protein